MNFPHVAYQTFLKFKNTAAMAQITHYVLEKIKTMTSSIERVKFVHKQIDGYMAQELENPVAKKFIKCQKGCSACCYTQVSVTQDEADLLASLVEEGHSVDKKRLATQAMYSAYSNNWYKLSYEERRCIFLNHKNECSIYDNRPSVCRTNNVLSDPQDCSTQDGQQRPVRLLNTHKADMAMMAHYLYCQNNGSLPLMLQSALNKLSKIKTKRLDGDA